MATVSGQSHPYPKFVGAPGRNSPPRRSMLAGGRRSRRTVVHSRSPSLRSHRPYCFLNLLSECAQLQADSRIPIILLGCPLDSRPPQTGCNRSIAGKAAEQEATKVQKRDMPWQALRELAANKVSPEDLAGALYGIVAKHPEPDDVLYAMITLHRKDASNAFKQALRRSA